MDTLSRRIVIAVVLGGITAMLLFGAIGLQAPARAAPGESCQLTWENLTAPDMGGTRNALYGVHALAENDVWAVGFSGDAETLIEHWNGSAWSIVPSPNRTPGKNYLYGVAGAAADDVWAVGRTYIDTDNYQPLILHWDGTAWSIVPSPDLEGRSGELHDVAVVASNDVWAVGDIRQAGTNYNLIQHWDGNAWSVIPSPSAALPSSGLVGISARNANDIWAAGDNILHWDGNAWTVSFDQSAQDILALASNDVWASSMMLLHWDGTEWHSVPPGASMYLSLFDALDGAAPDDIYAVGSAMAHGLLGVVQHYDGIKWNEIFTPTTARNTTLNGISVVSATDVWVVGGFDSYLPPPKNHSVILHGTLPCVIPTPVPTPTSTPTPRPPRPPQLESPRNGAVLTTTRLTLDWSDVKRADAYKLEVRRDSPNGVTVLTKTTKKSRSQTPALEPYHPYYWRVKTCAQLDAEMVCGPFSEFWKFTIVPQANAE